MQQLQRMQQLRRRTLRRTSALLISTRRRPAFACSINFLCAARRGRPKEYLRRCGSRPHGTDGRNACAASLNQTPLRRTLTDTVAAEFTCTHCNAVPEQVVDGKAMIAIVRHELGCPTLDGPDPHTLARPEALNVEVVDRLNPFG